MENVLFDKYHQNCCQIIRFFFFWFICVTNNKLIPLKLQTSSASSILSLALSYFSETNLFILLFGIFISFLILGILLILLNLLPIKFCSNFSFFKLFSKLSDIFLFIIFSCIGCFIFSFKLLI